MFGVSFPELVVLGTVALLVLGPEKLPGMLRTMGQWVAKLRRLTTEVRYQSGIDDVLRAEGFDGGLNELRTIMRGGTATASHSATIRQPTPESFVSDKSREYPVEGPDAYGALPEDLVSPAPPLAADTPPALPAAETAPALPPGESPAAELPAAVPPAAVPPAAELPADEAASAALPADAVVTPRAAAPALVREPATERAAVSEPGAGNGPPTPVAQVPAPTAAAPSDAHPSSRPAQEAKT